MKKYKHWMDRCIPLALHGDGVPIVGVGKSWGKSMNLHSIKSMVGIGTTVQIMYVLFAMFKDAISKGYMKDNILFNNLVTPKTSIPSDLISGTPSL